MVEGAMDTVVAVSIGILATIFAASLVALILVCKHRYCKPADLITRQYRENEPDNNLVESMEGPTENPTGVELDDVRTNTALDEILQDESWVHDATGLVPHCLEILRTCRDLTEKLVGMAMGHAQQLRSPEQLNDLVTAAKRISPRVDEVVKSMYPPLDPRLLEARCTALVLSVSHMVLVTKTACSLPGALDWVEQSLADVEEHLKVLQEASQGYESINNRSDPTQSRNPSQNGPAPSQDNQNVVQLSVPDCLPPSASSEV